MGNMGIHSLLSVAAALSECCENDGSKRDYGFIGRHYYDPWSLLLAAASLLDGKNGNDQYCDLLRSLDRTASCAIVRSSSTSSSSAAAAAAYPKIENDWSGAG